MPHQRVLLLQLERLPRGRVHGVPVGVDLGLEQPAREGFVGVRHAGPGQPGRECVPVRPGQLVLEVHDALVRAQARPVGDEAGRVLQVLAALGQAAVEGGVGVHGTVDWVEGGGDVRLVGHLTRAMQVGAADRRRSAVFPEVKKGAGRRSAFVASANEVSIMVRSW